MKNLNKYNKKRKYQKERMKKSVYATILIHVEKVSL